MSRSTDILFGVILIAAIQTASAEPLSPLPPRPLARQARFSFTSIPAVQQ
jgi:hypothetical protein